MDNREFTLKSGAKVVVTPSSFKDAMALVRAIRKAAFGMSKETDLADAIIISEEVQDAIFKCAAKATYNGTRITPEIFDDLTAGAEARKDYFEIFNCVAKANVDDFFERASSASKGPSETTAPSPESR